MKNKYKKTISLLLTLIQIIACISIGFSAKAENYYAQYSGSTEASWGYKPDCTFRINKIVGNKFRGSFAASNLEVIV